MSEQLGVTSVNDLEYDLEGTRKAEARLAAFFAGEHTAVHNRSLQDVGDVRTRGSVQAGVGRDLIARCTIDTQRRYETLLYHEERHPATGDFGFLIAPACQVVEAELDQLLTTPAHDIADHLVAALRVNKKDHDQAEILRKWQARQVPTTFGTHALVLLALRRGLEHGSEPIRQFLASRFLPRYVKLLASKKLDACLNALRTQFRNPACHGIATFDANGYEQFVRLALAQRRFTGWDTAGPTPAEPGPEVGVFHHHLSLSRRLDQSPAQENPAQESPLGVPVAAMPVALNPDSAEVFISYASRDRDRVLPIADRLQTAGVSLWLDRHKIPGGSNYGPEIVRGIKECKVLMLMCSDAALRSRNVKQEIQLAWKYGRPYLPLLLDPVSFPEQVEYWLEGWQWVEVLGQPSERWLPSVVQALHLAGVRCPGGEPATLAAAPAVQPAQPQPGLAGLRAVARFTDLIWPVPAGRAQRGLHCGGVRDLGASQDDVQYGHRIGSRVCLVVESDRAAHLLLLDEGPTGKVYCLCPSWFAPDTRLRSGRSYLPQERSRYNAFEITGQPGREHLLAIITEEPLGLNWMPADPRLPARVLTPEDVATLLGRLDRLEGNQWTALATYFDVIAGR